MNKNDTILVTGGRGFLGKAVYTNLKKLGFTRIVTLAGSTGSLSLDLTKQDNVQHILHAYRPKVVVHLAARVGGIGANRLNPGLFIYENLAMGVNLIEASRLAGVEKFVMIGTVCAYPKYTPVPFKEESIWDGYPEETNAPYGIAKKTLMQMIISYKQQYDFNGVNLIPVNMYGPYDNFNPDSSHVIPALILKFYEAMKSVKHKDVEVWGTGNASREFLYVDDCARAIALSVEHHNDPQPINIGTGAEIKISDLVELIADRMGYNGNIVWDSSKPDGQPRRRLDISRAERSIGFQPQVSLDEGLDKTIEWFKDRMQNESRKKK
jgi:GDP-L-fucose synthase